VDRDLSAGLSETQLLARLRQEVQQRTRHLALYQRPRDVLVLPDFSVAAGELTATLKLRRHQVWQKHGEDIRRFLARNGEDAATRETVNIASSRVMESLGQR
jgi:long-subunit acyl-CoA synthetase (AMP-forming)